MGLLTGCVHDTSHQQPVCCVVLCCVVPCSKNNASIVAHMEAEGIDFLQFAFRWVNCLLIREVPFGAALRLWDTYLAEGPRFNEFLVGSGGPLKRGGLQVHSAHSSSQRPRFVPGSVPGRCRQ